MIEEERSEENELEVEISKLRELVKGEQEKSSQYLTRLKYLQADFENYRKRKEKEENEIEDAALTDFVTSLLSALDELDLAVRNAGKESAGSGLLDGLKMVQKKLASSLESSGLQKIECVGKPFDPTLHEALEKEQGKSEGEDVVKEEIRPGYLFRNRVVRPSMVKVELALKKRDEQEATSNE